MDDPAKRSDMSFSRRSSPRALVQDEENQNPKRDPGHHSSLLAESHQHVVLRHVVASV